MEERIYGMENKIENLGNEFIELKSGQDKELLQILKLETKIENEITEKIRGLYDAREIINDKLSDINDKVDNLSNRIDKHELIIKLTEESNASPIKENIL